LTGGWALYAKDGRLVFEYNYSRVALYTVSAALPPHAERLEARFKYEPPSARATGAGGTVTLLADGKPLASGRLEHTLAAVYSMTDGLDVGVDIGSPVSDHYEPPFPFTGRLESVTIELQ
jgi:arylsulfatase